MVPSASSARPSRPADDPTILPGDILIDRSGRVQYQIQSDGSRRRLPSPPSAEDAVRARQRHAQDHERVAAKRLRDRSGLVTPASTTSALVLGEDVEREMKKLKSKP